MEDRKTNCQTQFSLVFPPKYTLSFFLERYLCRFFISQWNAPTSNALLRPCQLCARLVGKTKKKKAFRVRDTMQMLRMTMPDPMWAAAAAAAWWNEQGVDCRKTNSLSHSKSTRCDSVLAVGNGSGGSSGGGGCFGFTSHLVIFFSFFLSFLLCLWCTFLLAKGSSCCSSNNFTLAPTANSSHFHCACLPVPVPACRLYKIYCWTFKL